MPTTPCWQDTTTTRANETLGYIVIESGSGQLGAHHTYEAAVGPEAVLGMGDAPPYTYSVSSSRNSAVLSSAGMLGDDGGFPVIVNPGVSGGVLRLAIEEDAIGDPERGHVAERVAYIAIQ